MGVGFSNVDLADGLYPCFTVGRKQKVKVNFGKDKFKYAAMFEIYPDLRSYQLKMTKEQGQSLEQLFDKYRCKNYFL